MGEATSSPQYSSSISKNGTLYSGKQSYISQIIQIFDFFETLKISKYSLNFVTLDTYHSDLCAHSNYCISKNGTLYSGMQVAPWSCPDISNFDFSFFEILSFYFGVVNLYLINNAK